MLPGTLIRLKHDYLVELPEAQRRYWAGRIGVVLNEDTILWPGAGLSRIEPDLPSEEGGVPRHCIEPVVQPKRAPSGLDRPVESAVCLFPDLALDSSAITAALAGRLGQGAVSLERFDDSTEGRVLALRGSDLAGILAALDGLHEVLPDHLAYRVVRDGRPVAEGVLGERRGRADSEAAAALRDVERLLAGAGRSGTAAQRTAPKRRFRRVGPARPTRDAPEGSHLPRFDNQNR